MRYDPSPAAAVLTRGLAHTGRSVPRDEVLRRFLKNFQKQARGELRAAGGQRSHSRKAKTGGSLGDVMITLEDFIRYYDRLSPSVDDDHYFEVMLQKAWDLPSGWMGFAQRIHQQSSSSSSSSAAQPRKQVGFVDHFEQI